MATSLSYARISGGIHTEAASLCEAFRVPQMRQPALAEAAIDQQALALLRRLDAACTAADDLEHASAPWTRMGRSRAAPPRATLTR